MAMARSCDPTEGRYLPVNWRASSLEFGCERVEIPRPVIGVWRLIVGIERLVIVIRPRVVSSLYLLEVSFRVYGKHTTEVWESVPMSKKSF